MNPVKKKYFIMLGVLLAVIMISLVIMRVTRKQQPIEARTETGSAATTVSTTEQAVKVPESPQRSKGMAA